MAVEPISNDLHVTELLKRIGKEKNWSDKDVENDLLILEKNRIVTVNDLRSLSRESWSQIELLPLVKDLLRSAIDPNWLTSDQYQAKSAVTNMDSNHKEQEEDKKDKKKEKKKDKKKNKDKKKHILNLGEPVVPTVLNERKPVLEDMVLSEDPLTIENTIRNGTTAELSAMHITDDHSSESEDEPASPSETDVPTRRKSVTFSDEQPTVGVAASEGAEKKKEKKDKKKKDKKKKSAMASTNITSGYSSFKSHPYTNRPIVKFKKMKLKHTKRLPPAPANDNFLQGLHDKLMANRIEQS